ncbi:MAG: hypothetical protein K0U37_09250 [Gammaproteobacteria bacterium]|nr:hypothetical protein [Gammaproteobacteria bacterium]
MLTALKALGNNLPFDPDLPEKSGLPEQEGAFVKGDFGNPSNPQRCLEAIFKEQENEVIFMALNDTFLEGDNKDQLEAFCREVGKLDITPPEDEDDEDYGGAEEEKSPEAMRTTAAYTKPEPEASSSGRVHLAALNLLAKNLSVEHLKTYFEAMNELMHYAASSKEEEAMKKDKEIFKSIGEDMLSCVNSLKKMHSDGNINPKRAQRQIKKLGINLQSTLAHLDKMYTFSLEGKGNSKETQVAAERSLWNRWCYQLAKFFRVIFTILCLGLFRKENPLSKFAGYGTFFIYKPKTDAEKADIQDQRASMKVLAKKLTDAETNLKELTKEIDALDAASGNHLG